MTGIEERKKLHIGIAILTTIIFAMWAYECDPSDYSLTGWLALIAISYNVRYRNYRYTMFLRVLKLV